MLVTDAIEMRARNLLTYRVKPMDALHLACAEAASVRYFCTCDDRLLKRAKGIADLRVNVVSPLELVEELGP